MQQLTTLIVSSGYDGSTQRHVFGDQIHQAVVTALHSSFERTAIHVGFGVPDENAVRSALEQLPPGAVVASDAACAVFQAECKVGQRCALQASGLQFHYVVGWTRAETSERSLPPFASISQARHRPRMSWLEALHHERPEVHARLLAAGVQDEDSYVELDAALPLPLRLAVGLARYRHLAGVEADPATLLDNLSCAPPWLLALSVHQLTLSVRQANVLNEHSVKTVGDLARFGNSGLLKLPRMGSKSLRELAVLICNAMTGRAEGVQPAEAINEALGFAPGETTFAADFDVIVRRTLPKLEAQVVLVRSGQVGAGQSLREAASYLGVVDLRPLRQAEERAISTLTEHPICAYVTRLITEHLARRAAPLELNALHVVDTWLGTNTQDADLHRYFLTKLADDHLHFWLLDGCWIVSRLGKREWYRAINAAASMLADVHGEERLRRGPSVARAVLPDRGSELRDVLLAHLREPHKERSSPIQTKDADRELALRLRREVLRRQLGVQ
ncbi:DNA-directed RNA polymerase subunit alpha C-terminal domain-containing protein [Ramlibacter rhizophilus]|uniref:RNA polymerase alpha subunit C-terminal domain-containing protein n=1 Tax=Ramlibacter rhizophilus TaxID=1781167 RepID=A0A4Z0BXF4_9BURK|nr:DNA-directed RNA polymerase subunit alpha C-terminal domain-containing protein [Ramlibacter rhizophilus]TFZ03382.1 hypothetical protein EZ242_05730 [Ramlibacter rhizophilus]